MTCEEEKSLEVLLSKGIPQVEDALLSRLCPKEHTSLALTCRTALGVVKRRVWNEVGSGRGRLAKLLRKRYPLQYGMGEEAAELRLDLGGLGRVMCCVAGQQVVVVHSQDEERDEVVVVFCVNTGRLLGTFEGSRESLLGGGGVVSQTQSGIMEVRKVVDDGLLLLGAIEDLRRRALYCPAPSSPLLAIYGMIDGGEVVGQSVLRLYRMEKGLPIVRSLMPEIPESSVVSSLFYDGTTACLYWSTDHGLSPDYWHLDMPAAMRENMKEGEEAVRAQTRSTGLQMYTGLEAGQVKVTNVFLPVCHAFSLHRNHLVTVSVAPRGDRVSILDIKTGSVVSRVFNWKSFRAVTLQEGLLALRESTLDNLLMFDLADFLDRSREVESLACREISLGWQKLGVDTRTAWVVGGGRILSHREGQELIVRDFRRWKEQQE